MNKLTEPAGQSDAGNAPAGQKQLYIRVLGKVSISHAGTEHAAFAYDKIRALLGYLVANPGTWHRRDLIAELLWPTATADAARISLRRALYELRQVFEPSGIIPLMANRNAIGFFPDERVGIDLAEFRAEKDSFEESAEAMRRLGQRMTLYWGTLLDGVQIADSVEFDYWLQIQREALQQRAIAMLDTLIGWHLRQGQRETAVRHVRRKIELAPWIEANYCQLMELLAESGHFGQVWQTFIDCQRYLQREMGLEPETRTVEIAHRLRREHAATSPFQSPAIIQRSPLSILACQLTPQGNASVEAHFSELAAAASSAREVVQKHNGHFVALHANLLLAYFGFPKSRELAAREAIDAALELRHTISGFPRLDCQLAIHRGLGLLDERFVLPDASGELSQQTIAMLDTVSRNEIHVSTGLFEQVRDHFSGKKLTETTVGIIDRQNHRRPSRRSADRQPLIGRRHEMHQLINYWKDAENLGTSIVQVSGDPGIGKSKLLQAFSRQVRAGGGRIGRLQCRQEERHTPYYPLSVALGRFLGDDANLPVELRLARVNKKLARDGGFLLTHQSIIHRLLGLPSPLDATADPRQLKQHTESGICALLDTLSARAPLLLIIEDLHWSDEETLGAVRRLASERMHRRHHPLLIVTTSRQEENVCDYTPHIALSPLAEAETVELVRSLGEGSLGEASIEDIAQRSDGVPLYVEQILYALRQGMAADGIPETLHDLLAARIDAQGTHRKLAQYAAIIGREFDLQLLSALWDDPAESLQAGLAALRGNGLISQSATLTAFRHALIRDAAFQSIPIEERRRIQLRLARVLRSQFAEWIKQRPELLATHLHDAEDSGAALAWLDAGRKAASSSMQQQAAHFFRKGLEALLFLPDASNRDDIEFHLQVGLGTALLAILGYGNGESRQVFARALELSHSLGSGMEIVQVLWGLWLGGRSIGSSDHPLTLAHHLAHAARDIDDPGVQLQVNYAYGNNYFWLAHHGEARKHLEIAIEQAEKADNLELITRFGENSGVSARAFLAWVEWIEGKPDNAIVTAKQAIAVARETGHAHTLAFALTFAAVLHRHLRQPHEATVYLEELSTLAETNGLMLWRAAAAVVHGWVRCALGDEGGLELIRLAVDAAHEAMSAVEATFLSFWAEALFMLGRFDEALALVERSLETVYRVQDNYLIPEFLRIKGNTLLALHPENTHEGLLLIEESLAWAQAQGASTLALRSATSLVHHVTSPENLQELENCLNACHATGDFPDFSEARALLSQASRS